MLKIIDIYKRFGGHVVLDGVSLTAESSEIVLISGENGCGKSTLLRIACGILAPTLGDVEIRGHSLERAPQRAKAELGYVPDGMEALPDLLVSEFVAFVGALKPSRDGRPATLDQDWKERLGVLPFWHQRIGALSFGQRKRVAILAALSGNPWLLLLDEPTNGLDPQGSELVRELLAERSKTRRLSVVSTNDTSFASVLSARHHRIEQGKLVAMTAPTISSERSSPDAQR